LSQASSDEIAEASATYIFHTFDKAASLPADCAGSQSTIRAGYPATAPTTFPLKKNGVQFGTAVVTGTSVVYDNPVTAFAIDDYFEFPHPATPDATLCRFSFTFLFELV
jgi:hypothetical protein